MARLRRGKATISQWARVLGVAYNTAAKWLGRAGLTAEEGYYDFTVSRNALASSDGAENFAIPPSVLGGMSFGDFQTAVETGKVPTSLKRKRTGWASGDALEFPDRGLRMPPPPMENPEDVGDTDADIRALPMRGQDVINAGASIWEMIGLDDCKDESGMVDWSVAKTKAQAYRQAMAAAKERGELVERDLVLRFSANEFGVISSALNLLPTKLAPMLVAIAQSADKSDRKTLTQDMTKCVKDGINSLVEKVRESAPTIPERLETMVETARATQGGK